MTRVKAKICSIESYERTLDKRLSRFNLNEDRLYNLMVAVRGMGAGALSIPVTLKNIVNRQDSSICLVELKDFDLQTSQTVDSIVSSESLWTPDANGEGLYLANPIAEIEVVRSFFTRFGGHTQQQNQYIQLDRRPERSQLLDVEI